MKKILFVIPNMGIGGVQRSLVTLLNAVSGEGLDITLLAFCEGGELLPELPDHIHIMVEKRLKKRERLRATVSSLLRRLRLERLFNWTKKLYHRTGQILALADSQNDYDVAIAYADGISTWYVARSIHAKKKIAFVHTDFSQAGYDVRQENEVYSEFEQIVFSCQTSRQRFLSIMPEWEEKAIILPNVVDRFRILSLSEETLPYPSGGNAIRLLTVGRLSHEKGMDKIPLLLRKLKDAGQRAIWYIVGDGPERSSIQRTAKHIGVSNELILIGEKTNPYPYIRYCDVYIQPSIYESYCIALAEARALCRPIVTCDFAGAREQIKDGVNGFIVGMSVEKIYPAVLQLVSRSDLRESFMAVLEQEWNSKKEMDIVEKWWKDL